MKHSKFQAGIPNSSSDCPGASFAGPFPAREQYAILVPDSRVRQ